LTSPSAVSDRPETREADARRRWYAHGWNTSLSWKLILRITPRLPRFVLAPLHHLTSLTFFIFMPRERAAVRRNLRRVTGKSGLANLRLAYRLFWNFSRFMVAYAEMKDLELGQVRERLMEADEVEASTRGLLKGGRGLIVVTMHLGHWDLGIKLLTVYDVPVHVVMLNRDPETVTRYADEARRMPGTRVHQMGDPLLAVELMLALRRGELVALQGDRPVGENVLATPFFGSPAPLPTGPVQLAMASGAPVMPAFILLDRGRHFRLMVQPPLHFERPQAGQEQRSLAEGMQRLARVMESAASRFPDQWFNFYDIWPQEKATGRDMAEGP